MIIDNDLHSGSMPVSFNIKPHISTCTQDEESEPGPFSSRCFVFFFFLGGGGGVMFFYSLYLCTVRYMYMYSSCIQCTFHVHVCTNVVHVALCTCTCTCTFTSTIYMYYQCIHCKSLSHPQILLIHVHV